jgi:membrane protease YdiL (CAAX protease family)
MTPSGQAMWVVIVATGVSGAFLWLKYLKNGELWRSPARAPSWARWGAIDVLAAGFLFLATGSIAVSITRYWHGASVQDVIGQKHLMSWAAGIDGVAKLLLLAGLSGYLFFRYRHRLHEFGVDRSQMARGGRQGLICFAMWAPPVWTLQWLLTQFIEYRHESLNALQDRPSALEVAIIWFGTILVAPVVEEFLFRGIVQGWLQRLSAKNNLLSLDSLLFGAPARQITARPAQQHPGAPSTRYHYPSIVITSALFGLAHVSNGPAPVTLFVFSLGLGYLYQRTGSLIACTVTHMLLNLVTIAASTAMAYGY